MKNKLIASTIALFGCVAMANAQVTGVSATATAAALIVAPLSIENAGDMNFGTLAATGTIGTVILLPDGTRSATGGVMLSPANAGTITAAHFLVTGTAGYTYDIALPTTDVTLVNTGAGEMIADGFNSTPTVGTGGTLSGVIGVGTGTQTINVGATLHVGVDQEAGEYLSDPFTVTVNYN